jgi:hypothetical protein
MVETNRRISGLLSRTGRILIAITLASGVLVSPIAAGAIPQTLRATDGTVACLVSVAANGPQGQNRLAVQVRGPASPTNDVLASLPIELRDFSNLPIRVVLLTPAGSSPVQRLPVLFDPMLEHPVIEGMPSSDGFARAVFPRDWLVAGVTILGERMVVAPNSSKVTCQTRCAITEADAAQWR